MKIMIKCEQKGFLFSTADCVYMCVSLCVIFSVNSWQLTQSFLIFLHFFPPLSFRGCPHCFIPHHNSTVLGVATGIPTLSGHTQKHMFYCVLVPFYCQRLVYSYIAFLATYCSSRWPTCHPKHKISCNYSARHLPAEDVKNMWTYCSFFNTTFSNVNQPRLVYQLGKQTLWNKCLNTALLSGVFVFTLFSYKYVYSYTVH